jgi:outer membrane protein TolC
MKLLTILYVLFISQNNSWASQKISLEELTNKIQKQNLSVLQNAEKVYQSKVSIDEARLGMLPKLNLWSLGKVIIDPGEILDIVQDVAPFLVPANWFRLKTTEILYEAEKEGYVALQANEIFAARNLYYKVLMDQDLYEYLLKHETELSFIRGIAEERLALGFESAEVVREIQIQHLKIKEDVVQMRILVDFEKSSLAQALSLPIGEELFLAPINIPEMVKTSPIDPKNWEKIVLQNSPEINQFKQLIKVIPQIKKEIRFSFLGVPSLSRGTAGGIFDDLPVSSGLGFANGKQIAIVKSRAATLELQKKGIEETLKKQVLNVSQSLNSTVETRPLQLERFKLSELNLKSFKEKLYLGWPISLPEFNQTMTSLLQAQTANSEVGYSYVMSYDRLQRMSFSGPYAVLKKNNTSIVKKELICKKNIFGKLKCKEEE